MSDILCSIMGIADILAGGLIMYSFNFNTFSIIFGGIMIVKGGISFI